MIVAFWLLAILGVIGAFDTFYYHEWRARLPAQGPAAAPELRIHAARDFFYAVIFVSLPLVEWRGWWALAFAAVIVIEIALTMWDFVVEMVVRKPLGDVYAGERVTHNFMGIIYGAMIAFLIPVLWKWWKMPTEFAAATHEAPTALVGFLLLAGGGVFLSGVRDLYAALDLPHCNWPWPKHDPSE
jgi:hypothetical protein